jgi:DedD protein
MAEAQDVDTLKRRGRRRLVGAVALVLLAVIVLPMVFDPEPRRPAPPVSVRIPGEDESAFAPKLAPKLPEKKPEEKKSAEKKPEPKAPEPKGPPESERARAEAALANAEFVIPVGAFANPKPVTTRLAEAKLPYYTEAVPTAKGTVTRVRAGPFPSRDAADRALETLKGLGFKPGNVAAKS